MKNECARPAPFGLIAILGTATMLFAAFIASYVIRRTASDWNPIPLPKTVWVTVAILFGASVSLELARRDAQGPWLRIAALLGALFVAGQIAAWIELGRAGIFLQTSPHASFFYVLTGVHGAHVLGGLAALAAARRKPEIIGACAAYWHFLGAAWLVLVILLSVF